MSPTWPTAIIESICLAREEVVRSEASHDGEMEHILAKGIISVVSLRLLGCRHLLALSGYGSRISATF